MGLFPEEGGVGIEITAEVAGEEACLDLGSESEGDFLVEKGVSDFVLFALLPGGEDGFAGIVAKDDGTGFLVFEIFGGKLTAVDEGEGEAIGEDGTKFFHEIKSEAGAAGAVAMEEANGGVEADGFAG